MNGDKYIKNLVFNAKIGNSKDFKILWESHKFLLDQIFFKFCEIYPDLKIRRAEIYHFMYFWFWECIEKHNFQNNDPFSYNIKNTIIKKIQNYLYNNLQIEKNLIVKEVDLKKSIKKDKCCKNQKIHNALRALTPKQLQSVWLHIYEGYNIKECSKIIGIAEISFTDRINMAYRKFAEISIGIKTRNKKKKFRERIYALPK